MAYERLRSPAVDRLFDAILGLKDREECYRFFYDLCTIGEIRTMAHRLRAAEMLAAGATYEEIQGATGMSSATVSRIRRFLEFGADGYVMVLERLAALGSVAWAASGDDGAGRGAGDAPGAGAGGGDAAGDGAGGGVGGAPGDDAGGGDAAGVGGDGAAGDGAGAPGNSGEAGAAG